MPWQALQYISGEIVYGGRVTDENDRALLLRLVRQFFSPAVLQPRWVPKSSSWARQCQVQVALAAPAHGLQCRHEQGGLTVSCRHLQSAVQAGGFRRTAVPQSSYGLSVEAIPSLCQLFLQVADASCMQG